MPSEVRESRVTVDTCRIFFCSFPQTMAMVPVHVAPEALLLETDWVPLILRLNIQVFM